MRICALYGTGLAAAPAVRRFTGSLLNVSNGDACNIGENLRFVVSRDGQAVFTSGLVFPGKSVQAALHEGNYAVNLLDSSGNTSFGVKTLSVRRDAWTFSSGCIAR